MKALFFPFTFIPPHDLALLRHFFEQVIVLQPCRLTGQTLLPGGEDPLLEIYYPYGGGDNRVLTQAAAFEQWAKQQQDVDLKQALSHPVTPFFDDSSTHAIASRIRAAHQHQGGSTADNDTTDAPQFRSRLFLQIAHQFDVRSWEMSQGMERLNVLERHLHESLHASEQAGEDLIADRQTLAYGTFDNYMVAERFGAWCDMAAVYLQSNTAPGLLVTTSRAVIDHLMENLPQGRVLMQRRIPLDRAPFDEIRERIEALVADPSGAVAETDVNDPAPAVQGPSFRAHLFADVHSSPAESVSKACGRHVGNRARVAAEPSPAGVVYISLTS